MAIPTYLTMKFQERQPFLAPAEFVIKGSSRLVERFNLSFELEFREEWLNSLSGRLRVRFLPFFECLAGGL